MATLLQTISGNGTGYVNSYTISVPSVTAGSQMNMSFGCGANDTFTVTDNKSNTWNIDTNKILTGQRQITQLHVHNAASGTTTITVQFGASQFVDSAYIIDEWSGMNTTAPLDKTVTANVSSGLSYSPGTTGATVQANELVIGAVADDSSVPGFVGDVGYNTITTQAGFDLYTSVARQYKLVTSTGTQTWTITSGTSRQASLGLATYKQVTAGAIVNSNFLIFF